MTPIYLGQYQYMIKKSHEACTIKRVTQRQLAKALNRDQSLVSKMEIGERKLNVDVIEFVLIARLLGLNPNPILDNFYRDQKNSKRLVKFLFWIIRKLDNR